MSWLAAAELLPEAARQRRPGWAAAGFAVGWAVMWLTIRVLEPPSERRVLSAIEF